jgi:hypothetical protein
MNSTEPKRLGYAIVFVASGVLQDAEVKLIVDETELIQELTEIVNQAWKEERYADPKTPGYHPVRAKELREEYQEKYEAAANGRGFTLNEDDNIVVLNIMQKPRGPS